MSSNQNVAGTIVNGRKCFESSEFVDKAEYGLRIISELISVHVECSALAAVLSRSLSQLASPVCTSNVMLPVVYRLTKKGNVLFNDTLNTFYLRLYGVRHMV